MNDINIDTVAIEIALQTKYDLFVAAMGFEDRCTAIAPRISARRQVAFGFDHNHILQYSNNHSWFELNGYDIKENLAATGFQSAFVHELSNIQLSVGSDFPRGISVAIDISSFDRHRLASVVDCIRSTRCPTLTIDFYYSIASFVPPNLGLGRNEVAGPVHSRFAGRFVDPGRPLALVAGLGYEIGKVVGAAEYVQASRVFAFIPDSPVFEYEPEVILANKVLLDDLPTENIFHYQVTDPRRTVSTLDAIVRGLQSTHNVVLLPGGPKVFALCCLLTQTMHRSVAVWRVSTGSSIAAPDVSASGHTVVTRVVSRAATREN